LKYIYKIIIPAILLITILNSCAYYSFTGKSIPNHIKTVQIILLEDQTNRYDLELPEKITEGIKKYIDDYDLMDIENTMDTDAKVFGSVTKYDETIMSQTKNEIADLTKLTISISINFYDNKQQKSLVKKTVISASEEYNEKNGEEEKDIVLEKLIDKICEDTVLKLSSNW